MTVATMKHMPGQKRKSVVIDKPPIETQRRIADILSSQDDLIENNRKQIKLLEEAAQRLYKEWFVDLRFPGYEHTKIVDGVPEGWEKGTADTFFDITIGKLLQEQSISGLRVVNWEFRGYLYLIWVMQTPLSLIPPKN